MPLPRIFKISRKTFINPSEWLDYENLKTHHQTLLGVVKATFTPAKATREETFDEAMTRLKLTEADINQTETRFRNTAIVFLVIGLIAFLYAFYLLFRYTSLTGWLLGIVVAFLFFSQAFKYDFWSFQIKSRKLGVTFKE